jgi:Cu/Ag efflux protein CusF
MRKVLGFTLATLLTLTLSAAAEQVQGKVKAIDRADQSIVLEDGTKLTVSESHLSDLAPGDQVQAVYQTQDGKKVVTGLDHRTMMGGQETTNFGSIRGTELDGLQSAD